MKKALYLFWGLNALVSIAASLCLAAYAYRPEIIGREIGKDANIIFSIFVMASMIWTIWLGTHHREPSPHDSNDIFDIVKAIKLRPPWPNHSDNVSLAIFYYFLFFGFEYQALDLGSRVHYAVLAFYCLFFAFGAPKVMSRFLANSIYDRPSLNPGGTGGQEA